MCGKDENQPRTQGVQPLVCGMQAKLITMRRTGSSKEQVESYAQYSGVVMDVECMPHRLTNLLPSQLGFPYIAAALDFLHTFCTGIASKVIAIVDAIIMTYFKKILSLELGMMHGV